MAAGAVEASSLVMNTLDNMVANILFSISLNFLDLYHRNFCPSWSVSGPLLTQKQAGSIHVSGAPFICKCGILRHKAALCVLSLSQEVQLLK